MIKVSVPSRGILFPNTLVFLITGKRYCVSVPSRGLLFPNSCKTIISKRIFGFRPLSGYLISKYKSGWTSPKRNWTVSVPSRGILFPNHVNSYVLVFTYKWVSVPSRGILFPNSYTNITMICCYLFPSPLGVSYFQINKLILHSFLKFLFPSPLGVSYFQMFLHWCLSRERLSFRPLSGYLISK